MQGHEGGEAAANDANADSPVLLPGEHTGAPGVLVVSRHEAVRQATALYLRLVGGYTVVATRTLEGAAANELPFQPALLVVHAPHRKAISAARLQEIRGRTGAALILLASDPSPAEFKGLQALAPRHIFLMPADPALLMEAVDDALQAVH